MALPNAYSQAQLLTAVNLVSHIACCQSLACSDSPYQHSCSDFGKTATFKRKLLAGSPSRKDCTSSASDEVCDQCVCPSPVASNIGASAPTVLMPLFTAYSSTHNKHVVQMLRTTCDCAGDWTNMCRGSYQHVTAPCQLTCMRTPAEGA
jgi:hypothetical protein